MTSSFRTKNEMTVCFGWQNRKMTIPRGAEVTTATNLPEGSGFWLVETPDSLKGSEEAMSWVETYGVLIRTDDVEFA